MQTFLPYPDFERSARVLDAKRLGKQRVEVLQVVRALTRASYGWANHPAVLMWKGFEEALGRYGLTCCEIWVEKGFGDTCATSITEDLRAAGVMSIRPEGQLRKAGLLPWWLGDDDFHESHRSALIRKDPKRYGPLFPGTRGDLPYVWPVRSQGVIEAETRRAESAARRAEGELERARRDADRRRRLRSRAAKKAWRTRRRNARTSVHCQGDEG
jgi:hypothetical protein